MWALALIAVALGLCGMGGVFAFVALTADERRPEAREPCAGLPALATVELEVYDSSGNQIRVGDESDAFVGFAASSDRVVRLDGQIQRRPGMTDVKVCLTTGRLTGTVGYVSSQAVRAAR